MKYNVYTNNLNIRVFDIETMGLNPKSDIIISASFCKEDGSDLKQYFCEDPESEFLLLSQINDEFQKLDGIITYNGKKFDIPFIITRAQKYGFEFSTKPWNIDIYRYLKGYWDLADQMNSLTQSAVETALGIKDSRTDTIGGAECIGLYNEYLFTGNVQCKDKILLHNGDDVKQLSKIASSLSFLDFHKIIFNLGRNIIKNNDSDRLNIVVDSVEESAGNFIVNAILKQGLHPLSVFEECYTLDYDSYSGTAKLVIKTKEIENFRYVDLNKIPVNIKDYINMKGFSNNYLILKEDKNIYYKEVNKLIEDLLLKI